MRSPWAASGCPARRARRSSRGRRTTWCLPRRRRSSRRSRARRTGTGYHQRGIGPENEASFLGFVAGVHAPHAHARYSALVFAQGQILGVLARADRDAAREIAQRRYPGIVRDLENSREYWSRFRGFGTTVGRAVNSRFLRTNRVEGGLLSYGLSVRLLLELARRNDWKLVADN